MKKQFLKNFKLPDKPGVYFFKVGDSILYIGKATSLRDRVRSYFSRDLIETRGPMILDMVALSDNIEYETTSSVLEALILEANLIKKFQPKYNTKEKDNKSFNFVCITNDELPRVIVVRGRGLNKKEYNKVYGPFPNGSQLKEAMKIIRPIFPYFDNDSLKKNNREFYRQIGLIPEKEFKENIKNIKLLFEGKKNSIVKNLKIRMAAFSKLKDFENAARIRDQIYALNHINDIALIKEDISQENDFGKVLGRGGREPAPDHFKNHFPASFIRIEAYDIAHMNGKSMVGVMTVIENGEVNKNEYKKFIIRTQSSANDTGALEEVLSRRFKHTEWGLPNLVVVDGSTAQVNVAKRVLDRYRFQIPVVGVVKDDKHKAKAIIGDEKIIKIYKKQILLVNSESHRFAITFHKNRRNKNFLNK